MTIRYPKTVTFQSVHEGWHNAGRDELADNFAVFHASLFKLKDGLSRDRVPFHAVTSVNSTTFLLPSLNRVSCTIMSIAEAACSRNALSGKLIPAISIIVSKRDRASRALFAWIVLIEPS